MIDSPEVRYALIAAAVLLLLVAWWSLRSQFAIDSVAHLFRRSLPDRAETKNLEQ